ncbi:F-box protein interaction domain protein [Medicago truncatula]|uniref:F-box protein interaction domain protein n=1 Tax=Medicago truncatula TaxID=3880 RepID=G7IVE8_MEDTR|nr:F-box protein interaction domain protein [Medicago truncatula]
MEVILSSPLHSLSSDDLFRMPPLPTLPFDLIVEILGRLPVKLLLQLRCLCKSWNYLISHSKFAKKHLSLSTTHHLYKVSYSYTLSKCVLTCHPLDYVSTNVTTMVTQYTGPFNYYVEDYYIVGSCNGIICIAGYNKPSVILWNPSIRKFKELSIQEFPFGGVPVEQSGHFVSGKINWLASKHWLRESPCFIVSLDLGNESYQEILQPEYEEVNEDNYLTLGVLSDCLSIISGHVVWIMKEYGNKESWTKLFTVSYMPDPSKYYIFTKALCIFDNHRQVLLESTRDWGTNWDTKLIIYNSRNSTFRFTNISDQSAYSPRNGSPEACIESLISPWS